MIKRKVLERGKDRSQIEIDGLIFDHIFYGRSYPDLDKMGENALYNHFVKNGKKEHRCPSHYELMRQLPNNFDIGIYIKNYPRVEFKSDVDIYLHYYKYGRFNKTIVKHTNEYNFSHSMHNNNDNLEKMDVQHKAPHKESHHKTTKLASSIRTHSKNVSAKLASVSNLSVEDFEKTLPSEWTPTTYLENNPDLELSGITNWYDLKKHWYYYGRFEGRPYKQRFLIINREIPTYKISNYDGGPIMRISHCNNIVAEFVDESDCSGGGDGGCDNDCDCETSSSGSTCSIHRHSVIIFKSGDIDNDDDLSKTNFSSLNYPITPNCSRDIKSP
jgi:hypothetical protein